MPRSKPNHVQVHRVELGTWERDRIKRAELVAATTVLLPAAGVAVAGLGAGLAGYALYQWLKDGPFDDIFPTIKEALTPEWRDTSIPVWSDEQREEYRKANPRLIDQVFDGPAIFWSMLLGEDKDEE